MENEYNKILIELLMLKNKFLRVQILIDNLQYEYDLLFRSNKWREISNLNADIETISFALDEMINKSKKI